MRKIWGKVCITHGFNETPMNTGRFVSIIAVFTAGLIAGSGSRVTAQGIPTEVIENYPTVRQPNPVEAPSPAQSPSPGIMNIPVPNFDEGTSRPRVFDDTWIKSQEKSTMQPVEPAQKSPATTTIPASPLRAQETFTQPAPALNSTRVGGISLSRAAAERMALNLSLEGSYYKDARLVLMGKPSQSASIDAALLLTSLRLACESNDPYFSLDPDDGTAWNKDGQEAFDLVWERIRTDFDRKPNVRERDSSFEIKTISIRKTYPELWSIIKGSFPNLKTRLVFRPEWMRETRLGEILYKGDVLLKELSSGVSLLDHGSLRAERIDGYRSSTARFTAQRLLADFGGDIRHKSPQWEGHRLWFDLTDHVPRDPLLIEPIELSVEPLPKLEFVTADLCRRDRQRCEDIRRHNELRSILRARKLLPEDVKTIRKSTVASEGHSLDLSHAFPRMFIRRHDHARRADLSGNDPSRRDLSTDVNARIEQYASTYAELQALTDVFRAYIAAVQIAQNDASVCIGVRAKPLLESEKVAVPLPAHHPSELFLTFASFEYSEGRVKKRFANRGSSVSGGVSIRARSLVDDALRLGAPTEITRLMNSVSASYQDRSSWQADGRAFVAIALDFEVPRPTQISYIAPQRQSNDLNSVLVPNAAKNYWLTVEIGALLMFGVLFVFWCVRYRKTMKPSYAGSGFSSDGAAAQSRPSNSKPVEPPPGLSTKFNLVFSEESKAEKESMISDYVRKKRVDRATAMQSLINEWRAKNIK